jgi:serine/threonine protein kinase
MAVQTSDADPEDESLLIAHRWCEHEGPGWFVRGQIGRGHTAPVFAIDSPEGGRALKIYDATFSEGGEGEIQRTRIEQQLRLRGHNCASLVQVFDGGVFENRLYILMSLAPGRELEKCLEEIPRHKIRQIVDQIAKAVLFLRSKNLCHRDIKSANIFISDDFQCATLLDISVTRDIHDPVGIGTDHEGQLPIVATARYSPPEYLFRLLDPGPALWHALDIYQLGALLHDLIARQPLFQAEYTHSKQNRYRFAWLVATVDPVIEAGDVDLDLVFLARRALDKDWERRSNLRIEDFFADTSIQVDHSLQLLGLGSSSGLAQRGLLGGAGARRRKLTHLARGLEETMLEHLRQKGATAVHRNEIGNTDDARRLTFEWAPTDVAATAAGNIELRSVLYVTEASKGLSFGIKACLGAVVAGVQRHSELEMPVVHEEAGFEALLAKNSVAALERLAVGLFCAR